MKNHKKKYLLIIISICLCTVCSMCLIYNKTKGLLKDEYENELRMKSVLVSNAVANGFLRPITVAETMSKEVTMKEILAVQSKEEAQARERMAAEYLKSIRDGFGYSMVFAVSDNARAYFTSDGISRYINPEVDKRDSWYNSYLQKETDKAYVLDVDTDEVNNWALSVFINNGVYDAMGNYLGLCGVGVDMTELQRLLEGYERMYDVKINLIDKNGLIQVDTDAERIENASIIVKDLEMYSDGECYYEIGVSGSGSRTITYIDELEWYLIVEDKGRVDSNVYSLIMPGIICMGAGILLVCGIIFYNSNFKKEQKCSDGKG